MGKFLEAFQIPTEMLTELQQIQKAPKAPKTAAKIKRTDAFASIPLWWAAKTGDPDLMVYVDLIYRAWRAKGKTFPMPNTKGVSRKTKTRILLALERAGLITVEWRRFKSPVVTLIVSIF
jgi:hypothetical protein